MRASKYLAIAGLLLAPLAHADDATYVSTPYLGLRYRDGTLDQHGVTKTGHAQTLRLQLGYLWALTPHLAAYAEGSKVQSLFGAHYNDGTGRHPSYPAESDPSSTELSNAWLGYDNGWIGVRAGRQYLNLDNKRFFSSCPWRQNPQSFDGVTSYLKFDSGTTLHYSWLGQVNRTVGEDFPDPHQRRWKIDGHLLHVDQKLPLGTASVYGYFVKNRTVAANSVRTEGARWNGSTPLQGGRTTLSWTLEGARQQNYGNNPAHFNLSYHLFEASYGLPAFALRAGQESLGSNGHTAFNVAYGSGHSFDGWVGVFSVPAHGLVDSYGGLHGELSWHALAWQVTYHDFQPENGSGRRYGSEVDVGLRANLSSRFSLELQYGDYRAGSFSVNQHKLWLLAEYRYGKQPI